MTTFNKNEIDSFYPVCRNILGEEKWNNMLKGIDNDIDQHDLMELFEENSSKSDIPSYIYDIARLEFAGYLATRHDISSTKDIDKIELNPSLEILQFTSQILSVFFKAKEGIIEEGLEQGEEWVLVWKDIKSGKINIKKASDEDLLAIKLTIEGISADMAAGMGILSEGDIDKAFRTAVRTGILISPTSGIRRDSSIFQESGTFDESVTTVKTFTLQWHITNSCDLHCKHCYDREKRSPLTLEKGINILEDMRSFCHEKHVKGHICFSGGNPFMSPYFFDLYKKAADIGFSTSILGNPVDEEKLDNILDIRYPGYFQVSLEGLEAHNDHIRGEGFYKRVFDFLDLLKTKNISSAVMLTLTDENIDQVIPLAEELRGHADYFTFNRLSAVGEGAKLTLPLEKKYKLFLENYVEASKKNPIMGFKDNLINIILEDKGMPLFDGCTGYGCGAAFNFVTLLPDGEVHACRKFPSLIGNISDNSLSDIYNSHSARLYRRGCKDCDGCSIRHFCGGCLAVTASSGVDIFETKDPYCFKENKIQA